MTSFFITAAENGGYYIRKTLTVNGELVAGDIVFAGNIHTCMAYLRIELENSK